MTTLKNMHIISESILDNITLVDSPNAIAALPLTNLQKQGRALIARWDSSPNPIVITGNSSDEDGASGFALDKNSFEDEKDAPILFSRPASSVVT